MSHHCDLADTASLFFFLFAWHSLMIMHHHTRFDYKRFSRPEDTMVIIILIQCCKKLWPCSSVNQQEQNHKSAKQTYNSIQTFHTHPPTLWLYTHAHYNYTHTHIHSLTHTHTHTHIEQDPHKSHTCSRMHAHTYAGCWDRWTQWF